VWKNRRRRREIQNLAKILQKSNERHQENDDFAGMTNANRRNVTGDVIQMSHQASFYREGMTKSGNSQQEFSTKCGKLCGKFGPVCGQNKKRPLMTMEICFCGQVWKTRLKRDDIPVTPC
jgi:hypothetical protein